MYNEPKVFAVKHKSIDVRMNSRSGGIFTALSDDVLNEKGIIYGCVLNEKFEAIHIRAEREEERDLMRGSKYIQSELGSVFISVKEDLLSGKKVLFSGTSCQIAGLKSFLQKEYDNLFCVDIVCHGVPSSLVWKKYIEWQEKKYGKCVSVDFRNKKDFGWSEHVETLFFLMKNGITKKIHSKVYAKLFLSKKCLRPSCYRCPYKDIVHPSDITIADYWGIDKAVPGFNDNKGISLVLINNEKGLHWFKNIEGKIDYLETNIKDSMQVALIKPFEMPKDRARFWDDFFSRDFTYIAKKYGNYGFWNSLKTIINKQKRRIRSILKKFINFK